MFVRANLQQAYRITEVVHAEESTRVRIVVVSTLLYYALLPFMCDLKSVQTHYSVV